MKSTQDIFVPIQNIPARGKKSPTRINNNKNKLVTKPKKKTIKQNFKSL